MMRHSNGARRIAHVASFGNPSPGSFIPAITELASNLTVLGDRVTFVTLDVPGATWRDAVTKAGADLVLVRTPHEASEAVATLRPDIIHTHFNNFDVPTVLASGFSKARMFWHIHSWPDTDGALSVLRTFVKYNLFGSRVEAFIPVSHTLADTFAARGVARTKLRVVPNGIDCDWYRIPTASERRDARALLGFKDEKVILFFGWTKRKGGDVLWRALEQIDDPTVLLVGVPDDDRREFEKRARVTAVAHTDDTRSLYWAADLLAFPSRKEGFGFVLLEGIATGLPVVASDIPPVREVAGETPEIQIVPVGDALALARSLKSSLGLPRALAAAGHVAHRYSRERWVAEILALYDR
jgi:glycosyltransferase involved in cell wall biosynthesis